MAKTRTKKTTKKKTPAPVLEAFPGGVPKTKPKPKNRFGIAANKTKRWKQADEVLDVVTAVPTIFPDFNRSTRCGGLPVRRITVVHGPSHGGKTIFILGLLRSFLEQGYLAGYVDAEHATGSKFANETIGELKHLPNFLAIRPDNYEQTITDVDEFLDLAAGYRAKHQEFKSIVVVDSINKLVPKREMKNMLKAGSVTDAGAVEMTKGHHGRYRASMNQAWMDHLTPKIAAADCAMVFIAQERKVPGDDWAFTVKGGDCMIFDSSLVIRIMKASPLYPKADQKKNDDIIGFKHLIRIWKSKVGHMDGRHSDSYFHLSNGSLSGHAPGLNTAHDAFEVGKRLGIIVTSGSWFTYKRKRFQGWVKMVARLQAEPELLEALVGEINTKLAVGMHTV